MKKYKLPLADSTDIIFRTLTADEADRFSAALLKENPNTEEFIFNEITDHKYNAKELEAGAILAVVGCAMKLSGFIMKLTDVPVLIEKARANVENSLYFMFYRAIIQAQPTYTLKDLKQMTLNELMEELAFSEAVLGKPAIDTNKMRESFSAEKGGSKPKKGIKSVTPEELKAVANYFNDMGPNGEFVDGSF
jgi:hypothetical protein